MSTPPRPGMEGLTLVLLRRRPDRPDLPEDAENRIQQAHLDFLDSLRQRGVMAAAGPFRNGLDETLRGLCVYRVGVEEARQYAAEDPAVRAGWLDPEALTWWFGAGEVRLA